MTEGGTLFTRRDRREAPSGDGMEELRAAYRDAFEAALDAERDDLVAQLIDSVAALAGVPSLKDPHNERAIA